MGFGRPVASGLEPVSVVGVDNGGCDVSLGTSVGVVGETGDDVVPDELTGEVEVSVSSRMPLVVSGANSFDPSSTLVDVVLSGRSLDVEEGLSGSARLGGARDVFVGAAAEVESAVLSGLAADLLLANS